MDWWSTTGVNNCGGSLDIQAMGQIVDGSACVPTNAPSIACVSPPPPTPSSASFFDPWLNCDDLDLSAIIQHQANSSNASGACTVQSFALQSANDASQMSPQVEGCQQQQTPQSNGFNGSGSAHAATLASHNKHQILNIINNSRANGQHGSHESQVMQIEQQMIASGAQQRQLDSSSLGSSPIGSLNSSYSHSLSPRSPKYGPQQSHRALVLFSPPMGPPRADISLEDAKPLINNTHTDLSNSGANQQQQQLSAGYCFVQSDCCPSVNAEHAPSYVQKKGQQHQQQTFVHQRHQQESLAYFHNDDATSTATERANQENNDSATNKVAANRVYKSGPLASSATGGSSLLTSDPKGVRRQQQQQQQPQQKQSGGRQSARKANGGQPATVNKNGNVKLRRCRHITDYVLAEEEKRLLIKEGHTDFPMTCQSRPLTKIEERILRKIRRKIRNKRSAQCSRQRKKEYVEELERKYAEIVRENEELKQLLARSQQSPNQQQLDLHHHPLIHQTATTFSDDVCVEGQSSNESADMNWREIFQPQSVSARIAVAAAAQKHQQQLHSSNVIYN